MSQSTKSKEKKTKTKANEVRYENISEAIRTDINCFIYIYSNIDGHG